MIAASACQCAAGTGPSASIERRGERRVAVNRHAVTSREPEELRRVRPPADGDARRHASTPRIPRDGGGRVVAEDQHGRAIERWPREHGALAGPSWVGGRKPIVLAFLGRRHRERTRDVAVAHDGIEHAEHEPCDRKRRERAGEQRRRGGQCARRLEPTSAASRGAIHQSQRSAIAPSTMADASSSVAFRVRAPALTSMAGAPSTRRRGDPNRAGLRELTGGGDQRGRTEHRCGEPEDGERDAAGRADA